MKYIGKKIKKLDSTSILQGRKIYTDDLANKESLIIKLLRSPHPNALIKSIDTSVAMKIPGVECILTHEDVPKTRFTTAGQSFPETSPYDMLILDEHVRFVGDPVAIIAADTEKNAIKAMKLIKVQYEVLDPVLDPEKAEEGPALHSYKPFCHLPDSVVLCDYDKNIVGAHNISFGGDVDDEYEKSPIKIDEVYTTQAQEQSMMETFRSYAYIDTFDRLVIISSTQVPFHVKRHVARALEIPSSKVRVIKPRIGGGFGAKQTSETDVYAALVTYITRKPSKLILSRKETAYSSNSRHAMKLRIKIGAEKNGILNSIDISLLSDQGAYGIHAWVTAKLAGEKTLPLYRTPKATRFKAKVVYTNKQPAGAFRGFGATQGCFAVESAINQLAKEIGMDPIELRLKNLLQEGDYTMSFDKDIRSSRLKECLIKGKKLIGWDDIYPYKKISPNKILSVGCSITMQGSGIAEIDTSTAQLKLNEGGDYTLFVSSTDNGTGTDTVMTQIAAETLKTDLDNISLVVADTDATPYDPGSYASSGVYTTGNAVLNCSKNMIDNIKKEAAKFLDVEPDLIDFNGKELIGKDKSISIKDLATKLTTGMNGKNIISTGSFGNEDSPPPFMAGFAKIETDLLTGEIKILDYVGIVDCGKVMNKSLAKVQAEGGIVQGIGYSLFEEVRYNNKGMITTNDFFTYKIPSRIDFGNIHVDFIESFEPTGPYGAKSIGEIVINTPAPAIAGALLNGINKSYRSLPITPEKVLMSL